MFKYFLTSVFIILLSYGCGGDKKIFAFAYKTKDECLKVGYKWEEHQEIDKATKQIVVVGKCTESK